MIPLTVQDILPYIEGTIIKGEQNPTIKKVITRSKRIASDSLFFYFRKKEKLDVNKLNELHSTTIVMNNSQDTANIPSHITVVTVKSVKKAYRSFIAYYRSLLPTQVIGITGTSGKTTTKEMITHILSKDYHVVATKKNYNLFDSNAKVLLKMDEDTDFGIFEFGVGYPGNLANCGKLFGPYSGIITTIGHDHIIRYGTIGSYIHEKSMLTEGIGNGKALFLNSDCEQTKKMDVSQFTKKIIYFGLSEKAHYQGKNIEYTAEGMKFTLQHNDKLLDCYVPGLGVHNVYNALAAIAACHYHGVLLEIAIDRLKSFTHLERHLDFSRGINGSIIIDDTWNTNTTSIQAGLKVVSDTANGKRTIAILGKISELGQEEVEEHKKIGQMVVAENINELLTIGDTASIIANEAIRNGMNSENVYKCNDVEEIIQILQKIANEKSIIYVKTSMRESYKDLLKTIKTN